MLLSLGGPLPIWPLSVLLNNPQKPVIKYIGWTVWGSLHCHCAFCSYYMKNSTSVHHISSGLNWLASLYNTTCTRTLLTALSVPHLMLTLSCWKRLHLFIDFLTELFRISLETVQATFVRKKPSCCSVWHFFRFTVFRTESGSLVLCLAANIVPGWYLLLFIMYAQLPKLNKHS